MVCSCCEMSLVIKGYSENGTNLKVNENSIALLYNKECEPQHIMQVIVEF